MTIDMKEFAGEIESPAAVEQQATPNSFQRETATDDVYVHPEFLEQAEEKPIDAVKAPSPEPDKQEQNFKALSESVEKLKAEREAEKREYQLQIDMLRANINRQSHEEPKARKMFDGMEDSDIPNVGELRKAWYEREGAYNERIEELQVANQHSDYADVLYKYGKHLAETDPLFLQGLKGAENKALFAYQYAKKEQRFRELEESIKVNSKPTQTQQSVNAQKMVENARKPGTLAQAGGQSVLGKADYYATMSDSDFMKMASKHLESV